MATLAYTAAIQTRIAYILRGKAYSTLTADEKAMIDGTWSSGSLSGGMALDALTYVQQWGQHFWLDTPATVPSEWEILLVWKTVSLAAEQMAPDRVDSYERKVFSALGAAFNAYNRTTLASDPGATPEAATLTISNIRKFVLSGCVRRPGQWKTIEGQRIQNLPLLPDITQIDSCIHEVIVDLWGRAEWPFRRRATTLTITPYAITGATWTESTKTLTKTGELSTSIPAGALVICTDGTGATVGEYIVSSATANTVVLTTSIGSAADGQTDIEFTVVAVSHAGLASESFHSVAVRDFWVTASNGGRSKLSWKDGTDMAELRAWVETGTSTTGQPAWFRFETNGTTKTWYFDCIPDQTYTAKGEVYVVGPTLTTLSATTTAMARFPVEFHPTIKNRVYGKVLMLLGDSLGQALVQETEAQIETLLPRYADVGKQDDTQSVRDVYRDIEDITGCDSMLGGGC